MKAKCRGASKGNYFGTVFITVKLHYNFQRDKVNIQVWDSLAFSFSWVHVGEKMCV